MSSTRLPGKVLADLGGEPVLARVIERLRAAGQLDGIVVATSQDPSDDPLAEAATALGIAVVRGPLDDVLARYLLASELHPCEAVVRITADCPLIDPAIVDRVVETWRVTGADYVANVIEPRTFPRGMDTEVVAAGALRAAAAEAVEPYDREHVTPWIRDRPERFAQVAIAHDPPHGEVRLTLDTPEDLALLRDLVGRLGPDADLGRLLAAVGERRP